MKRQVKRPTKLVFNREAMFAALKSDDDLTRALAEVMCRFDSGEVVATAIELHDRLWQPEKAPPKKVGAPSKWEDGKKLYAWLAVESQWRADRQAGHPDCSMEDSIRRKFARLPRRGNGAWRVMYDTGARLVAEFPEKVGALGPDVRFVPGPEGGRHIDVSTVETARKYHRDGAALFPKMHPDRQAQWHEFADIGARAIISAGTKSHRK